ncbi:hypothetical protein BRN76_05945 [Xanthomonas oryzae pv. oryzae]|uniref:Uncharacterized protein n=1 Tax=Xanthomonas oryzae pv. oryzae (strain PXO99A) TaxID=360094 RepID=A0A0K0GI71_XANOP|nr:hypothetical protein PXO_04749 [Xanthomonas oryzae pv. oryzae PXO99A]AXM41959.1 hypothetical protein BRN51_06880 [Xanthomonas oryzae pv. oryzae]AXQ11550.1 hypothetical protein BCR61_17230 [Xanthomonas oryzae pv. oryzae]AXQ77464.1 hypothetical protein BXU03_16925 [Xanthomonas oryzae pv. oryzae]QBA13155.1 hypothetical protein DZA53_18735 [Xanthomonas oryzae pv. oryzae]
MPATTTITGRATASAELNHNCVAIGRRCDMAVASWGQVTTNDAMCTAALVGALRPPTRSG